MSEINFLASGRQGDVIEIGMETVVFGKTSLTLRCAVRNLRSKKTITAVEKIVFVLVDEQGRPIPHGKTVEKITDTASGAALSTALA
jgi:acyl-CoA hydrolase